MRFPSPEWASALQHALNHNEAYRELARVWEGEILLRVHHSEGSSNSPGVLLDLLHGECRSARFFEDASSVEAEFVFEGSRENWSRLIRRELDPVKGLLDGTFVLRGNLAKAIRFSRATKELVDTAATLPVVSDG